MIGKQKYTRDIIPFTMPVMNDLITGQLQLSKKVIGVSHNSLLSSFQCYCTNGPAGVTDTTEG